MSQRQWIIIIGVWVMVFLFLGFPSFFTKCLAILTGLLIIIFAYRIKFKENSFMNDSTFTDSKPPQTTDSNQSDPTSTEASSPSPSTYSTTHVA